MAHVKKLFVVFLVLVTVASGAHSQQPSEDGITLIIRFDATDDGLPELERILEGVSDAMASEPGFVSATVYRDIDQPNVFVLTEIWQTKEHHLEHFERINASGDWAKIKGLLVTDPQMGYYDVMPPG